MLFAVFPNNEKSKKCYKCGLFSFKFDTMFGLTIDTWGFALWSPAKVDLLLVCLKTAVLHLVVWARTSWKSHSQWTRGPLPGGGQWSLPWRQWVTQRALEDREMGKRWKRWCVGHNDAWCESTRRKEENWIQLCTIAIVFWRCWDIDLCAKFWICIVCFYLPQLLWYIFPFQISRIGYPNSS